MDDLDIDSLVDRLVPEFEQAKLEALDARDQFVALSNAPTVNLEAAEEARRRWQHLELACAAILQRLDELAECSAA